jgi:hypothetical protein
MAALDFYFDYRSPYAYLAQDPGAGSSPSTSPGGRSNPAS